MTLQERIEIEVKETAKQTFDEWIEDSIDHNFIVNSDNDFLGVEIDSCVGGPHIYLDTRTGTVKGSYSSQARAEHPVSIDTIDRIEDFFRIEWAIKLEEIRKN